VLSSMLRHKPAGIIWARAGRASEAKKKGARIFLMMSLSLS